MLSEAATTEISGAKKPKTFAQSKQIAKEGGSVASVAKVKIELETGKPIVTPSIHGYTRDGISGKQK
jgi:hypothetical protein